MFSFFFYTLMKQEEADKRAEEKELLESINVLFQGGFL